MLPFSIMLNPTVDLTNTTLNPVTTFKHKMTLTHHHTPCKMTTHCKSSVGFCSSFRKGDNTPIIKSVFLCLPFLESDIMSVFNPIMTAFSLGRNPVVPFRDTANLLNAVTRFFAVSSDGFTLQRKGITA